MKVRVKHFASLKKGAENGPVTVEIPDGALISDLMSKIGIKQDDVGILMVSGKQATFGHPLKENDVVTFIPHIGGG